MPRFSQASFALLVAMLAMSPSSFAKEPTTLMGRIAPWTYPDSKINGATMSDAATLNGEGKRTIASVQCKTVMTTPDPIEKVMNYYKMQLKPKPADKAKRADESASDSGRSVTFHEDSENRPLAIHLILVNTNETSTTLVISRAKGESETHIAWTQYIKI